MNLKHVPDPIDALAFTGAGILSYGCWLAWRPLGFIVFGALLLIAALAVLRGSRVSPAKPQ